MTDSTPPPFGTLDLKFVEELANPIYYGQHPCGARTRKGDRCDNMAYYRTKVGGGLRCGVHAKDKSQRIKLPTDPDHEAWLEAKYKDHQTTVDRAAFDGAPGSITVRKMRMLKAPVMVEGALAVFPNNKHGGRRDGWGIPELSPMRLGPVVHGQPGLPPALNLENFHQGSKKFPSETLEEFRRTQEAMFRDPVPHRHKEASGKKNAPECFVWIDRDGSEHHLTYVQSRQFYCTFYERLATATPEFESLKAAHESGTHIAIFGYDGRVPRDDIMEDYLDATQPFGHELVLYCLLTEQYPWRDFDEDVVGKKFIF